MWFATYLYRQGVVSAEDILEAVVRQIGERAPLGRLALELNMMTIKQIADVLGCQMAENEPFGRLAVKLGYLSKQDLAVLLMEQADRLRPLEDILIEMGVIDRTAVESHYAEARQVAIDAADQGLVVENTL
jgi:hypothetical protein